MTALEHLLQFIRRRIHPFSSPTGRSVSTEERPLEMSWVLINQVTQEIRCY